MQFHQPRLNLAHHLLRRVLTSIKLLLSLYRQFDQTTRRRLDDARRVAGPELFAVPHRDRIELMGRLLNKICDAVEMAERREKRKRWVQRGDFAVEVEVDVVFFEENPNEPCLEASTAHWLDEIARKAEAGDLPYLQRVGRVFQAIPS